MKQAIIIYYGVQKARQTYKWLTEAMAPGTAHTWYWGPLFPKSHHLVKTSGRKQLTGRPILINTPKGLLFLLPHNFCFQRVLHPNSTYKFTSQLKLHSPLPPPNIQQIIFKMKTASLEKGQIQPSGIFELFLNLYLDEYKHSSKLKLLGHLSLSPATFFFCKESFFSVVNIRVGKEKRFHFCRMHFSLNHTDAAGISSWTQRWRYI